MFFEDDICWCANSKECEFTDCFRHLSRRKPQPAPDIFTQGLLKGTEGCPYFDIVKEKRD